MQSLPVIPWNPVRAPKIRSAQRRAISLCAVSALADLEGREVEIRRLNRWRAIGGCGVVVAIAGVAVPTLLAWLLHAREIIYPEATKLPDIGHMAGVVDIGLLIVTFPIALLTSRNSRAKQINQFIDTGVQSQGAEDNP
jgi:hypothetical protein